MSRRLRQRFRSIWSTPRARELDRRLRQVTEVMLAAPSEHDDPAYRHRFLDMLFARSDRRDVETGGRAQRPSLARLESIAQQWKNTVAVHSPTTHLHDSLDERLTQFLRELAVQVTTPRRATRSAVEIGYAMARIYKSNPRSYRDMVVLLANFLRMVVPSDPASPAPRWLEVLADFGEGYAAGTRERALTEQEEIATAVETLRSISQREPLTSAERFQELFTNSPVAMALLDTRGRILEANTAMHRLLGATTDPICGTRLASFARTERDKAVVESLQRALFASETRGTLPEFQLAADNPDEPTWVRLHWTRPEPDNSRVHVVLADVTTDYVVRQCLHYLANYDDTTGLPNRRHLLRELDRALGRDGTATTVGLYAIRLDGLPAITTTLGPQVGATVLRALVARATHAAATTADLIAQLDQATLAVVITNPDSWATAGKMVKRMVKWLAEPVAVDNRSVSITPMVGAAEGTAGHTTAETLAHCVDRALDTVNPDSGVQRWTMIEAKHANLDQERNRQLARLPAAFDSDEVTLVHSPIARASTGQIVGSHAVPQWTRPDQWTMSAGELADLATRVGLLIPIVPWIVQQAASQAARWRQELGVHAPFIRIDLPEPLAVDNNLVATVRAALDEHDVPPHLLQLGVSESSVIDRHGNPNKALVGLTGHGIRLVLNGLGTSVRHLGLLPELLLYGVVIAPELTTELDIVPKQGETTVLHALIELGKNLKLKVNLQGIETPQHMQVAGQFDGINIEGDAVGPPGTTGTMETLIKQSLGPRAHQTP